MERDFMGLNSKDSPVVVKQEAVEGCKGSVQWPLHDHASNLPHFLSFNAAEEEKLIKAGTMATSAADAFDTTRRPPSGQLQNIAGSAMKHQLLGGVHVTPPNSGVSSPSSIKGTTVPWLKSNSSGAPAQLTIFYGGTVNVFNDISPEKAQAIMLLAGSVPGTGFNMVPPRAQTPLGGPRKEEEDNVHQPNNNFPPTTGLPSPVSVSSHTAGGPTSNSCEVKQTGPLGSPAVDFEPPKTERSIGSLSAATMIRSDIPQSRKASLARFLEKRKERAMNSAPYNLCKKSSENGTPGSDGATSSISISTGKDNR